MGQVHAADCLRSGSRRYGTAEHSMSTYPVQTLGSFSRSTSNEIDRLVYRWAGTSPPLVRRAGVARARVCGESARRTSASAICARHGWQHHLAAAGGGGA